MHHHHVRRCDQAKPDGVALVGAASTTTASSYTSSIAQNENEDEHDHDGDHQNMYADENLPCPVNALPSTTDGTSSHQHPQSQSQTQTWYERATNSKAGERRSKFITGLFEKASSNNNNNNNNNNPATTTNSTKGNHPAGLTYSKSAQSTPTVHNNSHNHHHNQHTRGRRGGPTSHPRSTPSSPPLPPSTLPFDSDDGNSDPLSSLSPNHATMLLPRRRSRLRLAFWRRSKHHGQGPGHPHSPPQSDSAPSTTASASSMMSASDHY